MAKKCERCGSPALNDQSEFCNRCGSSVIEGLRMQLPVCVQCGNQAPNEEVLFCNRCGMSYPPPLPEFSCPCCGHSITDGESVFCNRCGAPVRPEPEPEPVQRICGRCGTSAPDEAALFCNRCGTEYPTSSTCPRCGREITDLASQFCNRCGSPISVITVSKKSVCLKCGAAHLDGEAFFCNRCGTPISHPPLDTKLAPPQHYNPIQQQVSVNISKKKRLPVAEPTEDLWDPVPEAVIALGDSSYPQGQPAAPQKKKYSHLPLVADEFKEKNSLSPEIKSPYYSDPPREKKIGKKGLFDLMKR